MSVAIITPLKVTSALAKANGRMSNVFAGNTATPSLRTPASITLAKGHGNIFTEHSTAVTCAAWPVTGVTDTMAPRISAANPIERITYPPPTKVPDLPERSGNAGRIRAYSHIEQAFLGLGSGDGYWYVV